MLFVQTEMRLIQVCLQKDLTKRKNNLIFCRYLIGLFEMRPGLSAVQFLPDGKKNLLWFKSED